jgi:hypothetical protein
MAAWRRKAKMASSKNNGEEIMKWRLNISESIMKSVSGGSWRLLKRHQLISAVKENGSHNGDQKSQKIIK